jgi:NAD(P)-dependent dehydrogenase (short-subunit alcohol dehydrogenase family)
MRYEQFDHERFARLPSDTKLLVLGAREGSGNIGDAIAERQARRGWYVVGDDCHTRSAMEYDVPPDLDWSRFDYLVITLGYGVPAPIGEVSARVIQEVIWGSLTLPLLCARKFVQEKRRALAERIDAGSYVYEGKEAGRILFIGSYGHDHVLSNSAPYCAAKAGLAHAVRCLAWDLTPEFLVSIVHPYHVPSTPLGEEVVETMMRDRGMTRIEAENYQTKDLRLPEHLTPAEIAEYVNWMLDAPEAAWLSGQGVNLYGGVR